MDETSNQPNTVRLLNQSAVKKHALKCSQTLRAGKFDRVSQEFLDRIQESADNMLREINGKFQPAIHDVVIADGAFITGALLEKAEIILNNAVARLIQAKVQGHPSIGQTLKP